MTVPAPHLYVQPSVVIGTVESICHFSQVTLVPEVTWTDVETYCNPGGEAPGRTRWLGNMRVRMSYGAGSAWEFFSARANQIEDFVIMPADGSVTADNPSATFEAYIGTLPFIPDHEIGASATFDLEFRVIGEPVFAP